MAKAPAERPSSASLLIEELATVLRSSSVDAVLVKEPAEVAERTSGRGGQAGRDPRRRTVTDVVEGVPVAGFERTDTSAVDGSVGYEHERPRDAWMEPTIVERPRGGRDVADDPPVRSGRRAPPIVLAGAAVMLCALVIAAVAGAVEILDGAGSGATRVQRASFAIELPAGWAQRRAAPAPTLALSDRVTAATEPSVTLVAGHLDRPRSGADPLPAAHERRWTTTPRPARVSLGSIQALRYDATLRAGGASERTYVVPTTNGYLIVGCRGVPRSAGRMRSACDTVATTLRVRGASAVMPAPSPDTARGTVGALDALEKTRVQQRGALASASVARRVTAARALAAAHADAARKLDAVARGPQDRGAMSELERAMNDLSVNLEALASAASSRRRSEYRVVQARIADGESRLRAALRTLKQTGYPVKLPDP